MGPGPDRAPLAAPAGELSRPPGARRIPPPASVGAAAAAYLALLAGATLLPIRWGARLARYPRNWRPQLVPVRGLLTGVTADPLAVLGGLAGNVLLFVPFGLLAPLLLPGLRRWWRTLAAGAGASLLIELAQVPWPGVRRADVNDVLTNALGTLLGFLAFRLRWPDGDAPPGG